MVLTKKKTKVGRFKWASVIDLMALRVSNVMPD
jgi:hypothetical protein